jgi:hypothetical protein
VSVQQWGNVFLALAGLAAIVFPIVYARSPWFDSTVGRDTMTFAVAIVVVLGLTFAVRVFGLNGPPRALIATAIYAGLAFLFWRRVWVLLRIQRDPWGFAKRDQERIERREQRRHDRHSRHDRTTTPTTTPED